MKKLIAMIVVILGITVLFSSYFKRMDEIKYEDIKQFKIIKIENWKKLYTITPKRETVKDFVIEKSNIKYIPDNSLTEEPHNGDFLEVEINHNDKISVFYFYKGREGYYMGQLGAGYVKIDKNFYDKIYNAKENKKIRMVRTDDYLFYDIGKKADFKYNPKAHYSKIISSVSPWERPTQRRQSNFGYGYEYYFTDKDEIAVYIDNEWHLFGAGWFIKEFDGKDYDSSNLSESTAEWLFTYDLLSDEEKEEAMKNIPRELSKYISFDFLDN